MLSTLVTTPINHVLRSEKWACKRLQSFAGQTACIRIPPLINFKILINSMGEIQQVDGSIAIDTTIVLSSFMILNISARESARFEPIEITGNQSLANELINISKQINISMIFEHDLSKAIGDVPAHRITNAGRDFAHWQTDNFNHLSRALAEYWTEENFLLAKHDAINRFIQETQDLQHHIAQLEQRLNSLADTVNTEHSASVGK